MRKLAAFIGVAIGGYLGWLFGTATDRYIAWALEIPAGHTYTVVMTLVMVLVFGYTLRRGVGVVSAWHAAAEAKVERAETKAPRKRAHTGKTPPSPFPAFQA
jgi:uncharacterized membrane protein